MDWERHRVRRRANSARRRALASLVAVMGTAALVVATVGIGHASPARADTTGTPDTTDTTLCVDPSSTIPNLSYRCPCSI